MTTAGDLPKTDKHPITLHPSFHQGAGLPSPQCLSGPLFFFLFKYFLLGTFLIYISNSIPKVPHTTPTPLPTHSHSLALVFPCTGAYKVCMTNGPLCSDGRLGHLLIHMQLETRAPGYCLVHIVVPPIGCSSL